MSHFFQSDSDINIKICDKYSSFSEKKKIFFVCFTITVLLFSEQKPHIISLSI